MSYQSIQILSIMSPIFAFQKEKWRNPGSSVKEVFQWSGEMRACTKGIVITAKPIFVNTSHNAKVNGL